MAAKDKTRYEKEVKEFEKSVHLFYYFLKKNLLKFCY